MTPLHQAWCNGMSHQPPEAGAPAATSSCSSHRLPSPLAVPAPPQQTLLAGLAPKTCPTAYRHASGAPLVQVLLQASASVQGLIHLRCTAPTAPAATLHLAPNLLVGAVLLLGGGCQLGGLQEVEWGGRGPEGRAQIGTMV